MYQRYRLRVQRSAGRSSSRACQQLQWQRQLPQQVLELQRVFMRRCLGFVIPHAMLNCTQQSWWHTLMFAHHLLACTLPPRCVCTGGGGGKRAQKRKHSSTAAALAAGVCGWAPGFSA